MISPCGAHSGVGVPRGGRGGTTDGVKGRYFDGVLSACLVYDKALPSMQVYNWMMG